MSLNNSLIFFYAQWTKSCQINEGILNKLNSEIKNINIIKINTSKFYNLKEGFNIHRIPSYLLNFNNYSLIYKGNINYKEIKKWILDNY